MKISPNDPCPCGSGQKYKKCCRALHTGTPAPSPEVLMRSRYSAYALNLSVYIMETTHPESSAFNADTMKWWRELDFFSKTTRFVGLKIIEAEDDKVTFRATLFSGARDVSFTERSTFKMHDGKWKYFSGEPA